MNVTMLKRTRSSLLATAVAILVAACATGGIGGSTPERRAERLADNGEHADAASAYIGLAANAGDAERDRLTLLAIEQWLEAGDGRRARNALRQMPAPQGGELLWLWSSDAAALALWEGRPDDALRLLDPLSRQQLPLSHRLRVQALLADTWFQKGDPIRALELYRQREQWLTDSRDIANNRQRMWAGLLVTHPYTLRIAADKTDDSELKGWLALGGLATSTGRRGIRWTNGLTRWRERYADHPAIDLLEPMDTGPAPSSNAPGKLALLLPLSGSNETAGKAVQNGFIGGYFANTGGLGATQDIVVYDTNLNGGAAQAYADAVEDGAEFIVGPLLRDNVIDVVDAGLLPVPLLTLNYLPDDRVAPGGVYQFALAPEDEAASAAQRALADGNRRALALVPNNDWGRRLLRSFTAELEADGGTLLDAGDYQADKQDFSFEIENLLLLSDSVQRFRRLRANLGVPIEFDPRRRQDADLIFLAATAPAGRLLKSQLKFHFAGDLPVYSTSRIYSMDGRSNSDLNGLMFADTPWIVNPQPWIAELPAMYARFWPDERRLGRLHALGYDAYSLVAALTDTHADTMPEINGATGVLFVDSERRVHRRLAWAQFRNGEPVAMPGATDRLQYQQDDDDAYEETAPERRTTDAKPVSGL